LALSAAAGLVLLVLLATLLGSTLLIAEERSEALRQRDVAREERMHAEEERARAEANLDVALKALDAVYLKAIGEEKLLRQPAIHPDGRNFAGNERQPLSDLERELLKRGLSFYDQFARQNAASPAAALQTAQANYRVGLVQSGLDDHAAARVAFRAAVERFEALSRGGSTGADIHRQLAEAYAGLASVASEWPALKEALEKAHAALTQALALQADNARLYLQRGDCLHDLYRFKLMSEDYAKALEVGADDTKALCRAAQREGTARLARRLAARAVEVAPQDPDCHLALAMQEMGAEEPEAALKECARALELAPNSSEAFRERGHIFLQRREFHKALADAKRAVELQPNDPWGFVLLAHVYNAQGRYDESLAACDEALQRNPSNFVAAGTKGELQQRKGDYAAAVQTYTALPIRNPGHWLIYKRRARCFAHLGNYVQALADLRTSRERVPDDFSTLWWIEVPLLRQSP
jgi:tetratricopeptide (TPR) repeat protein